MGPRSRAACSRAACSVAASWGYGEEPLMGQSRTASPHWACAVAVVSRCCVWGETRRPAIALTDSKGEPAVGEQPARRTRHARSPSSRAAACAAGLPRATRRPAAGWASGQLPGGPRAGPVRRPGVWLGEAQSAAPGRRPWPPPDSALRGLAGSGEAHPATSRPRRRRAGAHAGLEAVGGFAAAGTRGELPALELRACPATAPGGFGRHKVGHAAGPSARSRRAPPPPGG